MNDEPSGKRVEIVFPVPTKEQAQALAAEIGAVICEPTSDGTPHVDL